MSLHTPKPWDAVASGYAETTAGITAVFSQQALDWLAAGPQDHILDLATGPGTLARLAAPGVARVSAVDFSPEMLRICRRQVAGLNVDVLEMDGQDLPFEDQFDAAFSMFGLVFFPDRLAGLRSMRRALRPGAWGCISSWLPPQRSTGMIQAMGAVSAALPDWHPGQTERAVWDNPEILRQAFEDSGFSDIEVEERQMFVEGDVTPERAWRAIAQGFAPLALARQTMAHDAWQAAEERGLAWLAGNSESSQSYLALLVRGRA
ncbi:MAG: ubiquinone/menaquinone biosynthesis C-methylase UbiE [Cognaticolwellia sp.]